MLAHPTPAIEAPGVTLLLASFFEAFRVRPPVFFEERRRFPHVDVESFLRLVSPVEPVEVGVAVGRVDSGGRDLPLGGSSSGILDDDGEVSYAVELWRHPGCEVLDPSAERT